jgi:hypothetical protein
LASLPERRGAIHPALVSRARCSGPSTGPAAATLPPRAVDDGDGQDEENQPNRPLSHHRRINGVRGRAAIGVTVSGQVFGLKLAQERHVLLASKSHSAGRHTGFRPRRVVLCGRLMQRGRIFQPRDFVAQLLG